MKAAVYLKLVRDEEAPEPRREDAKTVLATDRGDLALIALLFVLNLLPVAGELAGIGHWSPAIVGFAAGAALLTGRELWSQLRMRAGANTGRTGEP